MAQSMQPKKLFDIFQPLQTILFLLLAFTTCSVVATENPVSINSGTIHFQGMIVNGTTSVKPSQVFDISADEVHDELLEEARNDYWKRLTSWDKTSPYFFNSADTNKKGVILVKIYN